MWVSFLNFERGPGVLLLNFERGPGSGVPGSWSHFYTMPNDLKLNGAVHVTL